MMERTPHPSLPMNRKVGRVTPCAPLVWTFDPNGAHGVTRPTNAPGSGAPFVSLVGSWNLCPSEGERVVTGRVKGHSELFNF